jgi:heterodisulfide reductase subunit C
MRAIRNIAVKEGHVHPFFRAQGKMIIDNGRIFQDVVFINEQRAEMGLPPLPEVNQEEISRILALTDVQRLLELKEGEKN